MRCGANPSGIAGLVAVCAGLAAPPCVAVIDPHLTLIAESIPDSGYFRLDLRDGSFVCSNEVKKIFGGWVDDVLTIEGVCSRLQPDERARITSIVQRAIQDGTPFSFAARIAAPAGEQRDISVSALIERCGDRANAIAGIITDVPASSTGEYEIKRLVERMTLANRAANVGVWELNVTTREWIWDSTMFALYGVGEGAMPAAQIWKRALHPLDQARVDALLNAAVAGQAVFDTEYRIRWPNAVEHTIRARATVVRDTRGTPLRMVGTNWDVSEICLLADQLRREKDALAYSEARYHALVDATPQLVTVADADGRLSYVNERFSEYTGYTLADIALVGRERILLAEDRRRIAAFRALCPPQEFECEVRLRRRDGAFRWHVLRSVPFSEVGGNGGKWITSVTDIEDRKNAEMRLAHAVAELAHLAHHDALTGLPNRATLINRLGQALAQAARHGTGIIVLYVDLDRFKLINDRLGHAAGDRVLSETSVRLQKALRAGDIAGRVGGDEFVLVCNTRDMGEDAAALALRLRDVIGAPIDLGTETISVAASIGISQYPAEDGDPDALIRKADAAMYEAKQSGRNTHCFYSHEMQFSLNATLELQAELRAAISAHEFVVHYQPMVCLRSGQLIGAEALVRWQHPRRGLLQPGDFIPFAEEHGFISEIGDFVLHEACARLKRMNLCPETDFRIAVNVSAQQFAKADFVASIAAALARHGTDVSRLEIEITESLVMRNTATTISILRDLKKLGVKLSLDDFGTGYSSLAYIKNFPIDTLKIDRSFVRDIATDRTDQALAKTIITLAHSLGMRVVGEGVETEQQFAVLRRFGSDSVQGYLVSHPLPGHEFEHFKRTFSPLIRR